MRGLVAKAIDILERAGVGNPPVPGDELPEGDSMSPTSPIKSAAGGGHPAFIAVNSENGAMILTVSTIWRIFGHFSINKGAF
jgi:hypothetical protein